MMKDNKPLRILVVEDNPGDFVLLKKHLQRTGIPVESFYWAKSIIEVEDIIHDHVIDIVFLDLTLGDSTGIQSFITLNERLPNTSIIVLSGLSDMQVAVEAIALGAQDYLVKGEFDEKLLSKAIHYSLERKKILEILRESNERYEIVNKATLDVIWDWDFSTNKLYLSSSVKEMLGYGEQDVTIDWFFDRISSEDRENVRQSLAGTLKNGEKHWGAEFWFEVPNGVYKYLFSRGHTLFDKENKPYRMIGAATDFTEKRKLENELVTQQVNQQKLITETTIQAQEKERNELAKELHDNINQVLATVKMFLSIAKDDELTRGELVNRSYENITYAIEEIRKLSRSLVAPSLGDIGIREALQELTEEINLVNGLQVALKCENRTNKKLDSTIELMLYRIVQEQVNNIVKYAKAINAIITLIIGEQNIYLSIKDNGVGFDPSAKARGIGLKNINSRVSFYSGTLNVITAPGQGCTLEINIPV